MFIFDLLKRDDRRLQLVAICMVVGMFALVTGLWFVQIVFAKRYENDLHRNSFRTVHIPALRGMILDRNSQVLATNTSRYNVVLYLEELRDQIEYEFTNDVEKAYVQQHPETKNSKGQINLRTSVRNDLILESAYRAASNSVYHVTSLLEQPEILNTNRFLTQYRNNRYVPFNILNNLSPKQVAIFSEQLSGQPMIFLEEQPVRSYPNGSAAAHLLGYVQRMDDDELYSLPSYEGKTGVEGVYDAELRGQDGVKWVLINNQFYRQREDVLTPTEPGDDIYLTIDLSIQRAAEKALAACPIGGPETRGCAIVMDVNNGDILAMASSPTYDPNNFIPQISSEDWAKLNDPKLHTQLNRAIDGAYAPASTFKIITAIACLENGLDPNEEIYSPGEYGDPNSTHKMTDLAGPGNYNFERAFYRSSNFYFATMGVKKAGLRKILEVAKRFHLGEKTGIAIHPERAGDVPSPDKAGISLKFSSTPDVSIGQEITVTPIQMAGMIAVIANGGALYWPRIISHSQSSDTGADEELFAPGQVRDHVTLNPHHLDLIRRAMLDDTENPEGTAYAAFHAKYNAPFMSNYHVAGKTGTAEIKGVGIKQDKITWFVSYAPYEKPRYAVIVMVESGNFGGTTCAPIAEKIYEALFKGEQSVPLKTAPIANN